MKTKLHAILSSLALLASVNQLAAQGTAFTYQGRLSDGANAANGNYDLRFSLYGTNTTGTLVAGPLTNAPVAVSNGLFTVLLDFGANFPGAARWLEIGVRSNGSVVAYSTLSPRQPLTPTPYAITAGNVNGLSVQLNTNGSPNVIGGSSFNYVAPNTLGAFIGGGGAANYGGTAHSNVVGAAFGAIGGGYDNTIQNGVNSVVAGGHANSVLGNASGGTVGGGDYNQIGSGAFNATIAGGYNSSVAPAAYYSAIGGGLVNYAAAPSATIAGGEHNSALGSHAFVGGGMNNTAKGFDTIGGGTNNVVGADFSGIFCGDGNFIGQTPGIGLWSFIGGGQYNSIYGGADHSVIGGGFVNTIQTNSPFSTISGGFSNTVLSSASYSTIGGGSANTIGNGNTNIFATNSIAFATIPGGYHNSVRGSYSLAAGQNAQALHDGSFVWADNSTFVPFSSTSANQFLIRASGGVGIGTASPGDLLEIYGTAGSKGLRLNDGTFYHKIGQRGDTLNLSANAGANGSTGDIRFNVGSPTDTKMIVSRNGNVGIGTTSPSATLHVNGEVKVNPNGNNYGLYVTGVGTSGVGVYVDNIGSGNYGIVGNGAPTGGSGIEGTTTTASGVAGTATSGNGVIGITTSGNGVVGNATSGYGVFGQVTAAGGWAGLFRYGTDGNNSAYFGRNGAAAEFDGTVTVNGTFNNNSDRTVKEHFTAVSAVDILNKVAHLPITEWNYKQDAPTKHIGPMAQDFYATFSVGTDERHIAPIDEGGVALAAIQGLNQKIEQKNVEIQNLKQQNDSLEKRLSELEAAVKSVTEKK